MAYPAGSYGKKSNAMPKGKGGGKYGTDEAAHSVTRPWSAGTGNVTESRLNKGGDMKFRSSRKMSKSSY